MEKTTILLLIWTQSKGFINTKLGVILLTIITAFFIPESTISIEESYTIVSKSDTTIVEINEDIVEKVIRTPSLAEIRDEKYWWDNYLYEGIPPEGNYEEVINGLLIIPDDLEGIDKYDNLVYLFVHRNRGDIEIEYCVTLECDSTITIIRPYMYYGENIYSWPKYDKPIPGKQDKIVKQQPSNPKKVTPKAKRKEYTEETFLKDFFTVSCRVSKATGAPVEFVLAHAKHESGTGNSALAQYNNFHGIKCWSKNCGVNYADDHSYDRFWKFNNPEESFWKYASYLQNERYNVLTLETLPTWDKLSAKGEKTHCKAQWELARKYKKGTIERWSHGLSALGYATDRNFSKKLIKSSKDVKTKISKFKLDCQ